MFAPAAAAAWGSSSGSSSKQQAASSKQAASSSKQQQAAASSSKQQVGSSKQQQAAGNSRQQQASSRWAAGEQQQVSSKQQVSSSRQAAASSSKQQASSRQAAQRLPPWKNNQIQVLKINAIQKLNFFHAHGPKTKKSFNYQKLWWCQTWTFSRRTASRYDFYKLIRLNASACIQTIIQSYVFYVFPFFLLLENPRFLYRSFLRQSPPHIDAAQAWLQPHGSRLRPDEISKPKPHGVSENRLSIAHDRDNNNMG